ncbi:unnamed protein product [Leptosia nina]|uniref:Uncharacterized protein n=1 Tax=Leptosia nina TaxID=320188 RepID=A0AAV1J669_9NEOP
MKVGSVRYMRVQGCEWRIKSGTAKNWPSALALNGLALWSRANSWRSPRPRPAYIMCARRNSGAVEPTSKKLASAFADLLRTNK